MKHYNRGDSPLITCKHKIYDLSSDAWSYADPDSGYPKITIVDADGTTKVNATQMSKAAVGKYQYQYQLDSDAAQGDWSGFIETCNNTKKDKKYFAFEVE